MTRKLLLAVAAAALVGRASGARAEDAPLRAPSVPGAAEALAATVAVEKALLKEDLGRYEKLVSDRAQAIARLNELYAALDAAVRREDGGVAQAIDEALARLEPAERERDDLLAAERALVEGMRERTRKIDLLEDQMETLQAKASEAAGPLTARWDVVLLPLNQRGSFVLLQSGTLVSGTYSLEGGWSGSLRGTLVNRKVYLERIDSKLGRSGEFEGYLSTDGTQIRGSWTRFDLSGEGSANGQWSAVRRPQSP